MKTVAHGTTNGWSVRVVQSGRTDIEEYYAEIASTLTEEALKLFAEDNEFEKLSGLYTHESGIYRANLVHDKFGPYSSAYVAQAVASKAAQRKPYIVSASSGLIQRTFTKAGFTAALASMEVGAPPAPQQEAQR